MEKLRKVNAMEFGFYDIIVAGGGGAAIRAAIAAIEANRLLKVAIITKGVFGKSGVTANACSDRMAFHATLPHTEPGGEDAWKYHAEDIYRIGGSVSDYNLAEILAKNAKDAFDYLDSLGVPFAKKDGKAIQFLTDGSKYARACYTGPYTAVDIEKALVKRIRELPVQIVEHTMITDAIVENGQVKGAYAIRDDGTELAFGCKVLILGTGGAGELYRYNVFTVGSTGDGCALALRAGGALVNMEFIQIGLSSVRTKLACSGSLMRAIPRFVNEKGEEFLPGTLPVAMSPAKMCEVIFMKGFSWPVSNEDEPNMLDVAVFRQIAAGHRVFLDYAQNNAGFDFSALSDNCKALYEKESGFPQSVEDRQKSPFNRLRELNSQSIEWFKQRGIDLEKGDMVEIMPAVQHFQGGVKIGGDASTKIKGLFAAGECAGGQHGANRPGGNALLDCQVFGKIAGESAARYAALAPDADVSVLKVSNNYFESFRTANEKGVPAEETRKEIQGLMSRYASVVRSGEGVKTALKRIREIKEKGLTLDSKGLFYLIETVNVMETAIAVLTAIALRKESRGPHLFFGSEEDKVQLPRNDRDYTCYFVIDEKGGKLRVERREPVKPPGK